jgi:uncharacterized protein YkwD
MRYIASMEAFYFFLYFLSFWRSENITAHEGLNASASQRAQEISATGLDWHAGFWDTPWPAECMNGYYAENIGEGPDRGTVFMLWMASPPHREMLLAGHSTHIGYGEYWVDGWVYMVIHTSVC